MSKPTCAMFAWQDGEPFIPGARMKTGEQYQAIHHTAFDCMKKIESRVRVSSGYVIVNVKVNGTHVAVMIKRDQLKPPASRAIMNDALLELYDDEN